MQCETLMETFLWIVVIKYLEVIGNYVIECLHFHLWKQGKRQFYIQQKNVFTWFKPLCCEECGVMDIKLWYSQVCFKRIHLLDRKCTNCRYYFLSRMNFLSRSGLNIDFKKWSVYLTFTVGSYPSWRRIFLRWCEHRFHCINVYSVRTLHCR